MKNENTSKFLYYFLYLGTIITSLIYISWRIFFTIPFQYGLPASIAGILLILAETTGMLEAIQHYYGMGKGKKPDKPNLPISMYPHVDVFIATYNEDAKLLYKTINGCKNMDYPDKQKVHIYLCDDANRPEMKHLCDELQVGYITREEHIDAKAGNLNNALQHTTSPYIVTFDADMIPLHNFLMDTIPYMYLPKMIKENGTWRLRKREEIDPDERIGFIQSPQSFYNADLFQYYLYSESRVPNEQDYFYRDVQLARNKTNSAIYGGSNTVISRAALDAIGGFYTGVITEDFATGISIQAEGFTTYAINDVLANGLAPTDLKSLIKQRERWARGCIQTLKKVHILTKKGLHLGQRLSYLSSLNYWYTPFRRLMYILSPILFTVFHIMVVDCTLPQILIFWLPQYLFYNTTLKKFSGNIRNARWSNVYDTILFPSLLLPVLKETLGFKQKKFAVTNKKKEQDDRRYQLKQAFPHMLLILLSLIGITRCLYDSFRYNSIAYVVIIFWLIVNLYTLSMSVFFMLGRKAYRSNERFSIEIGVIIKQGEYQFAAASYDMSDYGLSIISNFPEYIPTDEEIQVQLLDSRYPCTVYAKVVQVVQLKSNSWKYGLQITSFENRDTYYHLLYDRKPDLPRFIEDSNSFFEDLSVNIHNRFHKDREWNRQLPRIQLYQKYTSTTGKEVELFNFNYEFLLCKTTHAEEHLCIDLGEHLMLNAKRIPKEETSHLKSGYYLYRIENRKDLVQNKRFKAIVKEWLLDYECKEQIQKEIKQKQEVLFDENEYI